MVAAGHSANSQLGPVLPTEEPSGQTFASSVQAFGESGPGVGAGLDLLPQAAASSGRTTKHHRGIIRPSIAEPSHVVDATMSGALEPCVT